MTRCILETVGTINDGYAIVRRNGRLVGAHRLALEKKLGRPIKSGLYALHKCHNRRCINPDHLYEGTHTQNMNDMTSANRQAMGSRQGSAKLTESMVFDIIRRLKYGEFGFVLAMEYGVNKAQISRIKNGIAWKHCK